LFKLLQKPTLNSFSNKVEIVNEKLLIYEKLSFILRYAGNHYNFLEVIVLGTHIGKYTIYCSS